MAKRAGTSKIEVSLSEAMKTRAGKNACRSMDDIKEALPLLSELGFVQVVRSDGGYEFLAKDYFEKSVALGLVEARALN